MALCALDSLCAATKTFRDLVTGQENWYGLKAYKLGQCIKGDKTLVSQGTLTNLEQRVEISVSTGFRKDAFFFFSFFLLSLGASPKPTKFLWSKWKFWSKQTHHIQSISSSSGGKFDLKNVQSRKKINVWTPQTVWKIGSLSLFLHMLFSSLWCFCSEKLRGFGQYFLNLRGKTLREKVQNAKKVDQLAQLLPLKNAKTLRY